jgi:CTP:molybdopterin cytidylyltransferase MocA/SAM-dependent methyltransferase
VTEPSRTAAIVLAAGAGTRFGGGKLLAGLDGRPVLDHVLATLAEAGLAETVVVIGPGSAGLAEVAAARAARTCLNPRPEDGLSSSVRVGLRALAVGREAGRVEAALIALGDQPLTARSTLAALLAADVPNGRSIVVPRYAQGGSLNPALVLAGAWHLADELEGDRGFGPLIRAHPELVVEVSLSGDNADVDTPGDLAALAWDLRVRANREQAERVREAPSGTDFYGPISGLFRANPARTDDPVLDALLARARPADTWLDVGAGAGRYALPLARHVRAVVALDPSPGMLEALREIADQQGITNVRPILDRWPRPDEQPSDETAADAGLIAHVGYDIEPIGRFLDAFEGAVRRECVAILNDQTPAAAASAFWPAIHGEERAELPALPEFLGLLRARGSVPAVVEVERRPRDYPSRDDLRRWVRQQLFVAEGSPRDRRLSELVDQATVETGQGFHLVHQPAGVVGVVSWSA